MKAKEVVDKVLTGEDVEQTVKAALEAQGEFPGIEGSDIPSDFTADADKLSGIPPKDRSGEVDIEPEGSRPAGEKEPGGESGFAGDPGPGKDGVKGS